LSSDNVVGAEHAPEHRSSHEASTGGGDLRDHLGGAQHPIAIDVEVGHRAHAPLGGGPEQHTLRARAVADGRGRAVREIDHHDVGLRAQEVDRDVLRARDRLGEQTRVRVIVGDPESMVIDRIQPRGGDDAGLPHAAAVHLAQPVAALDEVLAARDQRTDRRTEPLR
jgi:hypothetical protein